MENDEIELLAMQRLRNNKGKLNDKNVDCFVNGYNTCQLALFEIDNIIDIREYHREKCDNVKVLIDDSIHYGDLRRGYTQEEYTRIKRAQRISSEKKLIIYVYNVYSIIEKSKNIIIAHSLLYHGGYGILAHSYAVSVASSCNSITGHCALLIHFLKAHIGTWKNIKGCLRLGMGINQIASRS